MNLKDNPVYKDMTGKVRYATYGVYASGIAALAFMGPVAGVAILALVVAMRARMSKTDMEKAIEERSVDVPPDDQSQVYIDGLTRKFNLSARVKFRTVDMKISQVPSAFTMNRDIYLQKDFYKAGHDMTHVRPILAHEIGHVAEKDSQRMRLHFYPLAMAHFAGYWGMCAALTDFMLRTGSVRSALAQIATGTAIYVASRAAKTAVSRAQEYRADLYALYDSGTPSAFVESIKGHAHQCRVQAALIGLEIPDSTEDETSRYIFSTHPTLKQRVASMERAERHMVM